MKSSTLTFDPTVKAVYSELADEEVAETLEFSRSVFVDVDANDEPVGFEVLNASPELVETLRTLSNSVELRSLLGKSAA
jgi:uncharacterized protein YuzE